MGTPTEEAGMALGDRMIYSQEYAKGVFELYRDDGTDHPLWRLIDGECDWKNCDGEKGAYLSLHQATPVQGATSMINLIYNKVTRMLGCFLKFADFIMTKTGGVYTFYERYSIWRMVNYKV